MDSDRLLDTIKRISLTDRNTYNKLKNVKSISSLLDELENWDKEHPRKTILQDFLEKYPDAQLIEGKIPYICPYRLGYPVYEQCICGNEYTCLSCWNRELEIEA